MDRNQALLRLASLPIYGSSTGPKRLSRTATWRRANGILIKGGLYLESLAKVDVLVFDKTGTLTAGKPRMIAVIPAAGTGVDEGGLLRLAAAADRRSAHPLAKAVVDYAAKGWHRLSRAR